MLPHLASSSNIHLAEPDPDDGERDSAATEQFARPALLSSSGLYAGGTAGLKKGIPLDVGGQRHYRDHHVVGVGRTISQQHHGGPDVISRAFSRAGLK